MRMEGYRICRYRYRVFRIAEKTELTSDVLCNLIEESDFGWFASQEDACKKIREQGNICVNYTVLPILWMI